MIVTPAHARALGYCLVPGCRAICRRHGLDFREFVRTGLPVELLENINDDLVRKIVELVKNEQRK